MKLQYLGDSRDSFKWHYHDHLAKGMNAKRLDIIPMLVPNDKTGQGKIHAKQYPATLEIQEFCEHLREKPFLHSIEKLPVYTRAKYSIRLHKQSEFYSFRDSKKYFTDIGSGNLTFIDPCTGFEPKHGNDTHISFTDLSYLLDILPKCAIISVYQHKQQRKKMSDTYTNICKGIKSHHHYSLSTAIYNPQVMMVQITKCSDRLEKIREINQAYLNKNEGINVFS